MGRRNRRPWHSSWRACVLPVYVVVALSGLRVGVEGDPPRVALVAVSGRHDQPGAVGGTAAWVGQDGTCPDVGDAAEIVGGRLGDGPFLGGRPGARRRLGLGARAWAGDVQALAVVPQPAAAV